MLDQYQTIFAQNEVNGPIFVDLALEDLDYMNITVLGHRKIILKGAQELRKNSKLSNTQPNISLGPSRTKSDSKMFQTEDDSSISVTKSMNVSLPFFSRMRIIISSTIL